jgi:hypothetical protein
VAAKAANGPDVVIKIDTKTGHAWVLTSSQKGLLWQPVLP